MSANRLSQLEQTIMELGTEMFRIKHEVSQMTEFHEKFVRIMKGLRSILDDKGVITTDDFDAAVELGEALATPGRGESQVMQEIEKIKKTSH